MKILLVEDDKTIALGLKYSLEEEGYKVNVINSFTEANEGLFAEEYSLYILDLSLPDGSGYDLCKIIKAKIDIPIIFLTACDDEVNVVMGLELGADDYITKPFRVRELISRIKSVLRRYSKIALKTTININDIRINTLEGKIYKKENEVTLTALEYRLFLTFVNNLGQTLSRGQLLEGIWDIAGDFVNDNTLTVYIKRLRDKLEDNPKSPEIIKTIRGLGYKVGE